MVIKYAQEIYKNISTHKAIKLVKIKSSALIISCQSVLNHTLPLSTCKILPDY